MDSALMEVFCQSYGAALTQQRKAQHQAQAGLMAERDKITRDLDRLMQAIMNGVSGPTIKDQVDQLEARKAQIDAELKAPQDETIVLHPALADQYRQEIARLTETLTQRDQPSQAAQVLRSVIDRIELVPVTEHGKARLAINLYGDIVSILNLGAAAKNASDCTAGSSRIEAGLIEVGSAQAQMCTELVAGARYHHYRHIPPLVVSL